MFGSFIVGITLSEGILMRRTLALWGNGKKMFIALTIFSIGCIIPAYLVLGLYHQTLTFHSIPSPGMHCYTTGHSHLLYLVWVFLTVYDTGIMILTTIQGIRLCKGPNISDISLKTEFQSGQGTGPPRSALAHIMIIYRDGLLYYAYLVGLSALNVADYATSLLSSMERVIYSVLTSRVVLHLREQGYRTHIMMTSSCSVDIEAEVEFQRSEI
ncbi:hypothetical protein BDN72DRAFT_847721 [Pluteus cervinus]|uniref:Uncharacterized protein n=1 Tax=Pluteus cervinus TaxID=181527 RepID=A0ACD3ACN3_9AGAR|nr:hypothetical protein BDN72DRAFT_847721 [Pluteus cervinus]